MNGTTVDTESYDMDLDSGDDKDSDDNSDELMESQETVGANLGEDLHLRWLQSLAQPRTKHFCNRNCRGWDAT